MRLPPIQFDSHPLQRVVNRIVEEHGGALNAAQVYARPGCRSCGGSGHVATLQRAGATVKEPRTATVCGCARKRLRKEAQRRSRESDATVRQ